jgi:hypothetical protein
MHHGGETAGVLQDAECFGKEAISSDASSPISSSYARYQQSAMRYHFSYRIWQKFNYIRFDPFSPLRNPTK